MGGFLGADTQALRAHADRMQDRAARLLELRDALHSRVLDTSIWQGPDADAFRSSWSSSVAAPLAGRHDDLSTRAALLDREADEQDAVSETDGSTQGGGEGSHGDPSTGNPLLDVLKGIAKAQGLYKKIDSILEFARRIPSALDEYAQLAARGLQGLWRKTYLDELLGDGKNWQKIGEKVLGKLGLPSSLGKLDGLGLLNKLDDVAPFLKTGGRVLGKLLPGVDIVTGGIQAFTADNDYDRWSGGLSAAGGALLLAAPFTGPAAPVVAAIGAGLGAVSIGMDLGKMVWENREQIGQFLGDAATNVGNVVTDVSAGIGNAVEDLGTGVSDIAANVSAGIGNLGKAFGF
ncbi:WXG100 family type VII secretion target [Brachybacterium sp. AOP25-B2-12]|uniref:WXG100 family type VII secretion target n=1 Tax=Brachybacterium sp. AOP25-B2-12 TaxID=3457710 RepID=UPI0040331DEF